MKSDTAKTLRAFLIELAIYALLVVGYFFLVLHFLGGWLQQLEVHHRNTYGGVVHLLLTRPAVVLWEVVNPFFLPLPRRPGLNTVFSIFPGPHNPVHLLIPRFLLRIPAR